MPLFTPPRLKVEGSGTLAASGSEQTIKEITRMGKAQGYIDFTNMASGDTTVIRTYVKIKSGGSYILQGQRVLLNAQSPAKLMHIFEFPTTNYGFKITLEQTGGTNRNYDWMIFTEA